MKRFTVGLTVIILSFAFLGSPSILEAQGRFGGHGGRGGPHGGYYGGHGGGGGPHGGYYGGHGGWGYHRGYYPHWGFGFYWGFPIVGWPYAVYGGWPYVGWPYYPPQAPEAAPAYREPEQQQPYYWYYCQDPQGYFPYVKNCPGGWIQVKPNITPPNQ